jgi:hypothetical protein
LVYKTLLELVHPLVIALWISRGLGTAADFVFSPLQIAGCASGAMASMAEEAAASVNIQDSQFVPSFFCVWMVNTGN